MEFDEVVKGRRSIRGFLNKPVPKALIREILELAMAPGVLTGFLSWLEAGPPGRSTGYRQAS